VSDDFGISQDSLKTALQMMMKNGLQPTIENLALLADELNGISDPTERAQKSAELLGRNWAVLNPLLSAGGDAIKGMAGEVSESLIVTEESIKASEEWRLKVDELNDTVTGFKMTVGMQLIPVLNDAALGLKLLTEGGKPYLETLQAHNAELLTLGMTYEEYNAEMQRALDVGQWHIDQEGYLATAIGTRIGKLEILTETQYAALKVNNEMAAGYAAMKANIEGTDSATSGLNDTIYTATDLMKSYNAQLLYTIASQGLDADAALALADSMGLIDDKTKLAYDATGEYKQQLEDGKITLQEYNDRVVIMRDLLEGLDGKKYKTTFQLDADIDN
jgi:hypothetical protein